MHDGRLTAPAYSWYSVHPWGGYRPSISGSRANSKRTQFSDCTRRSSVLEGDARVDGCHRLAHPPAPSPHFPEVLQSLVRWRCAARLPTGCSMTLICKVKKRTGAPCFSLSKQTAQDRTHLRTTFRMQTLLRGHKLICAQYAHHQCEAVLGILNGVTTQQSPTSSGDVRAVLTVRS